MTGNTIPSAHLYAKHERIAVLVNTLPRPRINMQTSRVALNCSSFKIDGIFKKQRITHMTKKRFYRW